MAFDGDQRIRKRDDSLPLLGFVGVGGTALAAETAAAASSYSLAPLCLSFLPVAVTAGSLWLGKKWWEGKLLKE